MTKKSLLLSVATLSLAVAVIAPQTILAYKGDPNTKGPNYTPERHALMEKAFATNDYNLWRSQMTGGQRVTEVINAQNFAQFAKAHQLAQSGQITEANKIRTSLGLNQRNGSGKGQGQHRNR